MALDGTQLREAGLLEPDDGRHPRPGGQDDEVGPEAATVREDERGPGLEGGDGGVHERDAPAPARRDERGEEGAVVDLMVAGHLDAATERGAERGDESAAFAGAAAQRARSPSSC